MKKILFAASAIAIAMGLFFGFESHRPANRSQFL